MTPRFAEPAPAQAGNVHATSYPIPRTHVRIPGNHVDQAPNQAYHHHRGMLMNEKLVVDKDSIADFCRRHHITRLAIFGSALREDFRPDSDIDILVDFEAGHVPGFLRLFDMEEELSALFDGRKVDLRTPEDLSRYFRDKVVAQAEVQYACG
jgi:uncharacterized protein